MSMLFASDRDKAQYVESMASLLPDPETGQPGIFSGDVLPQIYRGAGRGYLEAESQASPYLGKYLFYPLARGMQAVTETAGLFKGIDFEQSLKDEEIKAVSENKQLTRELMPDPMTTGWAGNTINQFSGVIGKVTLGTVMTGSPIGGVSLASTSEGKKAHDEILAQTGDERAAVGAGLIEGGLTAAGLMVPVTYGVKPAIAAVAGGKSISPIVLKNMFLYAPAAFEAQGMAGRYAMHEWLDSTGHHDLAEQYKWYDAKAIMADYIMGIGFGGLGSIHLKSQANKISKEIPHESLVPSQIDAALVINNHLHTDIDTAPGIPANSHSLNAHSDALRETTNALIDGREPDIEGILKDAKFIETPQMSHERQSNIVEQSLRDAGLQDVIDEIKSQRPDIRYPEIPRAGSLSPKERAVEDRMIEKIGSNIDAAVDKYSAIKESDGGRILNTDMARQLSEDYSRSRENRSTFSEAVHEPASWVVKKMYAEKLLEKPTEGKRNEVLFTAGGTASGKTTAVSRNPLAKQWHDKAQIIYDTNLNSTKSAVDKIDQALAAGKKVKILYIHRDPIEAFKASLDRAMNPKREGRTVPIESHAETHVGSPKTIKELADIYKDNPNVYIKAIENSTKGQKLIDVHSIPELDYNQIVEKLRKVLEKEHEQGKINDAVYSGTVGKLKARGSLRLPDELTGQRIGKVGEPIGQKTSREVHGDLHSGGNAKPETGAREQPEVIAAEKTVSENPNLTAVNESGEEVSASSLLSRADAELRQAEKEASGFIAAVDCFLRFAS